MDGVVVVFEVSGCDSESGCPVVFGSATLMRRRLIMFGGG